MKGNLFAIVRKCKNWSAKISQNNNNTQLSSLSVTEVNGLNLLSVEGELSGGEQGFCCDYS